MKKIMIWIPVLFIAGMVIYSSSQPYTAQDLRPFLSENFPLGWVSKIFGSVQFFYAGREVSIAFLGPAAFIEFFLRKGAHFSVFFCLGFAFYFALQNCKGRSWKIFFLSWLFVILFALSDETHQYFTGDRTPLLADVILDSLGGLTGIVVAHLWRRKRRKKYRGNKSISQ